MMILKSMIWWNMIKKILLLVVFISTLFAQVDFRNANLYKADINSTQAYEMQQNGVLLIDVRTVKEYKTLHAKNSVNIPVFYEKNGQRVFNKSFLNQIYQVLNKKSNKKVILICRSGSRTKLASNLLAHNNFTNVYNVKDGFIYDWVKVKLPVEK